VRTVKRWWNEIELLIATGATTTKVERGRPLVFVLGDQPVEHPLGRMPLLARTA
jgi:hypothetical protein